MQFNIPVPALVQSKDWREAFKTEFAASSPEWSGNQGKLTINTGLGHPHRITVTFRPTSIQFKCDKTAEISTVMDVLGRWTRTAFVHSIGKIKVVGTPTFVEEGVCEEPYPDLERAMSEIRDRMPPRDTDPLLVQFKFFDESNTEIKVQFYDNSAVREKRGKLLEHPIPLF